MLHSGGALGRGGVAAAVSACAFSATGIWLPRMDSTWRCAPALSP